jgi:hypothetical protein
MNPDIYEPVSIGTSLVDRLARAEMVGALVHAVLAETRPMLDRDGNRECVVTVRLAMTPAAARLIGRALLAAADGQAETAEPETAERAGATSH